jgi:hypothetical protein
MPLIVVRPRRAPLLRKHPTLNRRGTEDAEATQRKSAIGLRVFRKVKTFLSKDWHFV